MARRGKNEVPDRSTGSNSGAGCVQDGNPEAEEDREAVGRGKGSRHRSHLGGRKADKDREEVVGWGTIRLKWQKEGIGSSVGK